MIIFSESTLFQDQEALQQNRPGPSTLLLVCSILHVAKLYLGLCIAVHLLCISQLHKNVSEQELQKKKKKKKKV